MSRYRFFIFSFAFYLSACASSPVLVPTPQVISVYASLVTRPWLDDVYACAEQQAVIIRLAASPTTADIRLRFGEPKNLAVPAYQIGSDDLLVIAHPERSLQNLTLDQVRSLFSQGQDGLQPWVFASGEDIEQVFERELMQGLPVNSLARLVSSPDEMLAVVANDAIGFLPRRWLAGDVREVYLVAENLPVLALTNSEPQGEIRELLACLQK